MFSLLVLDIVINQTKACYGDDVEIVLSIRLS